MGRAPCCDKANVKKGPWSSEEDATLKAYIEQFGTGGNWIALPQKIVGLKRCGKSCRLRWLNYLRPNIKHGGFSEEEDDLICKLYISIGSRWSIIAAQLPGRTDNDIKNYWNTRLKKKLLGKRKQSYANRLSVNDQDLRDGKTGIKDIPALSNSAMERLQLHMHLQRLQNNPLSFYNNPTLWPKLQNVLQNNESPNPNPLMQHLLPVDPQTSSITLAQQKYARTEFGNNTQIDHNLMLKADNTELSNAETDSNSKQTIYSYSPILTTTQFHSETIGISDQRQAPCLQLAEVDAILHSMTTGCTAISAPDNEQIGEFDCFKEMNGSSSKDSFIWWSNEFENAKSTSFNSWDSMTTSCVPKHVGMMLQDYHELGYNL